MGRFSVSLSSPLRQTPKAICPSCGEAFEPVAFEAGNRRSQVYCGKQYCYGEAIRVYWRKLGYEATVKYEDGCPRLVGIPIRG